MVTTAKVLVAPSPVLAAVSWPMSVLINQKDTWTSTKFFMETRKLPRSSWRWWWGGCRSGGCRIPGSDRTWTWGRWWSGSPSSWSPPSSTPRSSWPWCTVPGWTSPCLKASPTTWLSNIRFLSLFSVVLLFFYMMNNLLIPLFCTPVSDVMVRVAKASDL